MIKEFTPTNWDDAINIVEALKAGDTAIVDFSRLDKEMAVRAMDFTMGAVHGLDLGFDYGEDRSGRLYYCFGDEAVLGHWLNDRPHPSNVLLFPGVRVG